MNVIDLRSDTVTRPTREMYEAILSAPLGDDVLRDEPTVNELEALAAEMVGKEAAMFVPSGTMGNQIALAVHTRPGDSALFENEAHMLFYESGAPAVIAQVVTRTVKGVKGVMQPDDVAAAMLHRSEHTPGTRVICLENTHNRAGGTIIPMTYFPAFRAIANDFGATVHLDGARVFNAAVALGIDVREITRHVDSVNFCLSKGLRSPVGSVLCGTAAFIRDARYWRKRLGGSMRQAGILAACGLVSLRTMIERLADDHARARRVAEAANGVDGITVDLETVQTNIVMLDFECDASLWQSDLQEQGVRAIAVGPRRLRLVFHGDIDDEMTDRAIDAIRKTASSVAARTG